MSIFRRFHDEVVETAVVLERVEKSCLFPDGRDGKTEEKSGERRAGTLSQSQDPIRKPASGPAAPQTTSTAASACFEPKQRRR